MTGGLPGRQGRQPSPRPLVEAYAGNEVIVTGDRNDVEKRWHDPAMFRAAVTYVVCVIAVAGVAFAAAVAWHALIAGILVPVILFSGGVGALVQAYRVWKAEGVWPIWQGAGWFLLMLTLVCLGVPVAVA
jgi:hypothetical protein